MEKVKNQHGNAKTCIHGISPKYKCKECMKLYNKLYLERWRDKKENREYIKKYKRKYNREHPEKVKAWQKTWNIKRQNTPKIREKYIRYSREWRKSQIKKLKNLIGDKCIICDSAENIIFHEIHGKSHKSASQTLYVEKHWKDFIPLCFRCHRAIHQLADNMDKLEIYIEFAEKIVENQKDLQVT